MALLGVLAVICAVIGIIGSVVPGLPGPPVSWLGMLLAYFGKGLNSSGDPMSLKFLVVWLVITIVISVLDWIIPAWFTRVTGGHKSASTGAIAGLIVGALVPPVGMILGSLLGAFIAEYFVENQGVWASFKSSLGAFVGFLCGTGIKLIASGVMFYYILVYL